jgi:hypothetical protein
LSSSCCSVFREVSVSEPICPRSGNTDKEEGEEREAGTGPSRSSFMYLLIHRQEYVILCRLESYLYGG